MTRRRISILTRVGLLALAIGILLRLFTHSSYTEFTSGFLIGLPIVLLIDGQVRQPWGVRK